MHTYPFLLYMLLRKVFLEFVEEWLKEGSVELTVTRVNMHGPPGAGKTCAQDLLLNNPPTTDHLTKATKCQI